MSGASALERPWRRPAGAPNGLIAADLRDVIVHSARAKLGGGCLPLTQMAFADGSRSLADALEKIGDRDHTEPIKSALGLGAAAARVASGIIFAFCL